MEVLILLRLALDDSVRPPEKNDDYVLWQVPVSDILSFVEGIGQPMRMVSPRLERPWEFVSHHVGGEETHFVHFCLCARSPRCMDPACNWVCIRNAFVRLSLTSLDQKQGSPGLNGGMQLRHRVRASVLCSSTLRVLLSRYKHSDYGPSPFPVPIGVMFTSQLPVSM